MLLLAESRSERVVHDDSYKQHTQGPLLPKKMVCGAMTDKTVKLDVLTADMPMALLPGFRFEKLE